jgi:UDP-2-acetamido-3-amino-2,3-dideoxy-glucuronate N-acetyltransferase
MNTSIHSSASVSSGVNLGHNCQVWNFSQIRENASVGENSTIGSYVYIDVNVQIGKNCKIQNRALIYDSAKIHDGVFIGPGVIFTNDKNPRSITVEGEVKNVQEWHKVGVEVHEGASIGAGAICVAPVRVGKWAMVGAGSVVMRDVRDYALVVGNPARQVGWVGPAGVRLQQVTDVDFVCPKTMTKFGLVNSDLHEII